MGGRVIEHDGTLEHFAGDGMHIFFNDPVLQPDHVLRAVRMAVAMREDVARRWRRAGRKRGYDLGFGVGIADRVRDRRPDRRSRAATTTRAIGNAVILAARLSGKAATGQILVSQRCYGVVEDAIDASAVDGLQLKGLSHPVTAWNVTGLREAG